MKRLLLISALYIITAKAQEVPVTTEQQLENLAEEAIEDDALLQQLEFYRKHPINLNTATVEDLSLLKFLTGLQMQSLLSYRALFGKLLSIYELQAVPNFDLVTINKLIPYIYVGEPQTVKEAFSTRLHGGNRVALLRVSRVLETSKGYDRSLKSHYLGNQNHLLFRYNYQYKNLMYYGLVGDKDAGEQFLKGVQKGGFDFYSLHFFARNLGKVKAVALGDYAVQLGQGLIQWQSLAFGKSAEVMSIKRQSPVLLPYRSAGEFFFNRGAAATIQWGTWQATTFFSFKKFTGNLGSDSIRHFTSFGTSGYHRTGSEVADRNKISHFSSGGNLSYEKSNVRISLNAVMHRFSLPLQKRDEPYNRFAFSGKSLFLTSVDYSFTQGNAHFFGELAADQKFHRALVQGALFSLDPKVDFSVLYRNISKEYQSPFGKALTESSLPSNENGLYAGIQLRPITRWQLAAYADFFQSPFLKYRVSAPARGRDYLVQATFVPDKKTEIYVRYRTENKPLNGTGLSINFPQDRKRQNLRVHLVTQLDAKLSLKARTEITWFEKKGQSSEEGFLTYVEASYEPLPRLRGNTRLQYFETGGYDSRIYAYESDVLYSFSTPAFFDKGFRVYLNMAWHAAKSLTVWLRFSQTIYQDKQKIGSGLDEIKGFHKSEIKCQFQWNL